MKLDQWFTTPALKLRTWEGGELRAAWIWGKRKIGSFWVGEQGEKFLISWLRNKHKKMLMLETSPDLGVTWELDFI
jgi:hypothetical protein